HVFTLRARCVIRGRVCDRLRPAFPRYIFVDPLGAWNALRNRFGIFDYVRDGERVAIVPDAALNSLLRTADPNGVLPMPEILSSSFAPGDRVIVQSEIHGVANQRAEFKYLVGEHRAFVLLDWLSASVPVEVDERMLVLETVRAINIPRRKRRRRRHGPRQRGSP